MQYSYIERLLQKSFESLTQPAYVLLAPAVYCEPGLTLRKPKQIRTLL